MPSSVVEDVRREVAAGMDGLAVPVILEDEHGALLVQ